MISGEPEVVVVVGVGVRALVGVTVTSEALLLTSTWVLGRMMILATRRPATKRIGRITQSVSSLFKFFMRITKLTIANMERRVKSRGGLFDFEFV